MSSTVCVSVFVFVLRSIQAFLPICGSGYRRGVVTSPFRTVQLEFLSDSIGDGAGGSVVAACN